MARAAHVDMAIGKFPLSSTQEMWRLLDDGDEAGAFGPRFITCHGMRIRGSIDVEALRGALNDVVRRHEILSTIVRRQAEPPCQEVYPPRPVPLDLRDLRSVTDRSRDELAGELLLEAEHSSIDVRDLPLLRAMLGQLDDLDWALILVTHHSASDGWSIQVMVRDLAAFYQARLDGSQATLPDLRQYREFAAWQQARLTGAGAATQMSYWREKLDGARTFALPTDRPVPERHSRPYSARNFTIDADVIAAAAALARSARCSTFMVLLGAFNVLAHQITGTTDPVIDAITTGRNEPQFHDTVGPFLNFLPLRTDIGNCETFRDLLMQTRRTCLEAYSHEMPIESIKRELPGLFEAARRPENSDTILGLFQAPFDSSEVLIADEVKDITLDSLEPVSSDLPQGIAWAIEIPPEGKLTGTVQYNGDEFDDSTIADWIASYHRILSGASTQPDTAWREL